MSMAKRKYFTISRHHQCYPMTPNETRTDLCVNGATDAVDSVVKTEDTDVVTPGFLMGCLRSLQLGQCNPKYKKRCPACQCAKKRRVMIECPLPEGKHRASSLIQMALCECSLHNLAGTPASSQLPWTSLRSEFR